MGKGADGCGAERAYRPHLFDPFLIVGAFLGELLLQVAWPCASEDKIRVNSRHEPIGAGSD